MKTKINLVVVTLLLTAVALSQAKRNEVLTLGTFHFAFHNRDIKKIEKEKQIDVLDKKYQAEMEIIVARLAKFKPSIIAIEVDPSLQPKIDSLYAAYVAGNHTLNREEYQQIGFRLAKKLNLQKLYCVNDWGRNYKNIDSLLTNPGSHRQAFTDFFYKNPDTALIHYAMDIFKTKGILAQLKELNNPENIKKDLGNYLVGTFKYETEKDNALGVDFTTGWWFNRNLKIFRNIQKIQTKSNDKILVIYGAGHMNLLNLFFDVSPEYTLKNINDYLN